MQIHINELLEKFAGDALEKHPVLKSKPFLKSLNAILKIDKINAFLREHDDKTEFDFIDAVLHHLNFSYYMSNKHRYNIPSEGRLIIVANHPLGGLDGLALLRAISEVRKDVKIVANQVLSEIPNLANLLLPFNVFSIQNQKNNIKRIEEALDNEEAVIFFPAGEVSRLQTNGIRDKKWMKGAVSFAARMKAPVLPIYIDGKNSAGFYTSSMLNKHFSTFLLPGELFKSKDKHITLNIGNIIPAETFSHSALTDKIQSKLLRKHVYRLAKNKQDIFKTENTIIHPVSSKLLKKELTTSKLLGNSGGDKFIYSVDYNTAPNVVKEIARLREITFRKVGEGTGKSMDFDTFDKYYKHIVVWDDKQLEIMGSYRLGISSEILQQYGKDGLYNSGQFEISDDFMPILEHSIELGRSFIQEKYWKTRALDYLWQGIATLFQEYPEVKYLYGAVSISDSYSDIAKEMIIFYYKKWYSGYEHMAKPFERFSISHKKLEELDSTFTGRDHIEDFHILKQSLKNLGHSIPVLFRKYTELCDFGGVKFIDFSVDADFNNSVDGFIVIDLSKLRLLIRDRYYKKEKPEQNKLERVIA